MTNTMKNAATLMLAFALACGGAQQPTAEVPPEGEPMEGQTASATEEPHERVPPPESGPRRDISFPAIARSELNNGLEVNVVSVPQLPVVYLRLVVRSGGETDPEDLQGLSSLVAKLLKEGTRSSSSEELAERVEFLGASLGAGADEESVHVTFRALSAHLDEAMDILAEVVTAPAFDNAEIQKLQRRETDRLALLARQPNFIGRQVMYGALYGEHPYGRYDVAPATLEAVTRRDLQRWHRTHFVPGNAFLVAVGDIEADAVNAAATRAFGRWRGRTPSTVDYPEVPTRQTREVIVVDRPGSVQSLVLIGNLAVPRRHDDWVSLQVANQVLGGSAASRLFMDLREQRSLTYGAYSVIGEREEVGPFLAYAAVRTPVTGEAVGAFFEHLERIVAEPASAEEIANAQRYLSDSFPLDIDTPGKIARMVADLRIYGLADDYWDTYRTAIGEVSAEQALAAAQRHIHPDRVVVMVVGEASEIAEGLRRWGSVRVVDASGETRATLDPLPAAE